MDAALELFVDRQPMHLGRWPDVDANDPAQGINDNAVDVYGASVPGVAGHFTKAVWSMAFRFSSATGLLITASPMQMAPSSPSNSNTTFVDTLGTTWELTSWHGS
ncbi:MAG: hypothetical protein IPP19_10065 [Verrucomicrobia bacterium]|nr:hypothetical protein [Verrucomicrobiota bacterium]